MKLKTTSRLVPRRTPPYKGGEIDSVDLQLGG